MPDMGFPARAFAMRLRARPTIAARLRTRRAPVSTFEIWPAMAALFDIVSVQHWTAFVSLPLVSRCEAGAPSICIFSSNGAASHSRIMFS